MGNEVYARRPPLPTVVGFVGAIMTTNPFGLRTWSSMAFTGYARSAAAAGSFGDGRPFLQSAAAAAGFSRVSLENRFRSDRVHDDDDDDGNSTTTYKTVNDDE